MNAQIEIIKRSIETAQAALAELQKEAPGLTLYMSGDMSKDSASSAAEYLQAELNRRRLKALAIAKLSPQDREALGI